MEDMSIDQKRLPGVKEVCRDFAVLEDHCLAHNLQEQEIENHLASNIHKSRLVQQDLRVAKRLQEEEDQRAKAQSQKQHQDIERIDNEIAQEIQEQLVRQAEKQKQQEAKDEAIARKLQEREMKEERRRQKQLEAKLEEQYYEDKGAYRPPSDPQVEYSGSDLPVSGRERNRELSRGRSPEHWPQKLDQNRRLDSHGRSVQEEYGMREAMQGLSQMDLRAQELRDMEVARRIQEEELMASKLDKRAAQVAQDEEIARRFMEEEEREYKKSRERERQQRRPEGDSRPTEEEMDRPRTREEYDYQKARNPKSSRPPPHIHNYVNVDSSYAYSVNYSPRPPSRPEAAYKGAYYRQ
ncbi:coiled-coil domain-containing protein 50 isoform X3 [Pangasianodon hypophthalmus]|uniref:coiled-coil domain-containing protein 50 isoform X3 n=1 Tax=Pangasianodon hypophthalmus TaxID=310915 RepID=UPI000F00D2D9|nr:coiled-coil domain-containing protein 50 isoform X3 [Pangasianodon hypophthalmus]